MKRTRIVKIVVSILLLMSLIVGFSYAQFKFKIESKNTNLVQSGCLKIELTDANNIDIKNAIPMTDALGLTSKPYTYTIKNTCDLTAYYESTFNVLNTSNLDNQEKIRLSLKGDTYMAPTTISNIPVATLYESDDTVSTTYLIDTGFILPNQEKTFELRMWIDYDVAEITGTLEGKVIVNSKALEGPGYNTNTSGYTIYKNTNIETTTEQNPNYNYVAPFTDNVGRYTQTSGLYKYDENRYFFRGNVLNNYISFGKYQENETITYTNSSGTAETITHNKGEDIIWRIVGINSDGSLRLILNDLIGYGVYDVDGYTDDYLVGDIFNNIDTWINKHYANETEYLVEGTFCEDRDGTGNYTNAYIRNIISKSPSLECADYNSIAKKYGLLTIDEAALAGLKHEESSPENYLTRNYGYWTLSPMEYVSDETRGILSPSGISWDILTTEYGIVPVINLSSDAIITGTGTETNKYQVIGLYKDADDVYIDASAPTIVEAYTSDGHSNTGKNIIIFAKDNDEGTGIAGYIIKQTNQIPELNEEWVATNENKITTSETYNNGTYYIWIKDNSSNISEAYTLIIDDIDTTLPTCSISIDKDGVASSSKVLTITTTDEDVMGSGYSWDNTLFKENTPLVITENGTYTGYVKDKAGNIGSCSITVTTIN